MDKGMLSKPVRGVLLLLSAGFCLSSAGVAAEYAVLTTGYRIFAERVERSGELVRLHARGGVTELPAQHISHFELDDAPPLPPQADSAPAESAATASFAPAASARELVELAALRHGLPPAFVHSVAAAESAYRQDAVSPKGAIGIMQLMPGTAAELNADPLDPAQNVDAGVRYLHDLLIRYQRYPDQVRRALAAYNAGPGAVDRHNGIPPYRETQQYVNKVLTKYRKAAAQQSATKDAKHRQGS
jgi:soluble lytic murein transglycosylase-like protein